MAKTKGQSNPPWNREETILAFNLFNNIGYKIPSINDPRVLELSQLLKRLPFHSLKDKADNFRNVASVRFKMQNLQSLISDAGMPNCSKMDREIVKQFSNRPHLLKTEADEIINSCISLEHSDFLLSDDELEVFREGKIVYAIHRKRERSKQLRKKVLLKYHKLGLKCDICSFQKTQLPLEMQEAFFEVHHIAPLSTSLTQQSTKITDTSLLCANCHRAIHKLMSIKKEQVSIEEAKSILQSNTF